MKKFVFGFITIVALALGGCGAPPPAGSCQVASAGFCISYTGSSVTMSAIQQGCTASMGTYQTTDCPTANRVGRCTLPGGNASLTQTANYYAPATTADVMTGCTALGGTFAAN